MKPIPYYDRQTGKLAYEKVFGGKTLAFLYGGSRLGNFFKNCISKNSFASSFMGFWYNLSLTKRNILPFIEKYAVDPKEFLLKSEDFVSFNDFFTRKLKPEARPIASSDAVIPADARYWFYENMTDNTDFLVKGERLNQNILIANDALAKEFEGGAALIARLCPSDYHRFHFPVDCIPGEPKLINGPLFSVNPIAIQQNIRYLTENKRILTILKSPLFGKIAYIEIGATSVGSIKETYTPNVPVLKGSEKGYFEFGGSSLILLFQKNAISFSPDLVQATKNGYEIRCLMGQKMGLAKII